MKLLVFLFSSIILGWMHPIVRSSNDVPKTLPIGSQAPDFNLPATDGKNYSLSSFSQSKLLVLIFTCNHCPTAQAYEDRMKKLVDDYSAKGVSVVAIMPNHPGSVRLDELGYTDMGDSFDEMKIRYKEKQYNFVYLYDGENEAVSKKYGPIATPHVYIFDQSRKLRYSGRIDDTEKPGKPVKNDDTRNAIDALLQSKTPPVTTTKVFGCSVKWEEKADYVLKSDEEWAKQPVSINTISEDGIRKLIKNESDKLRLINIWATWCGPCVTEFPDFVKINRMYRNRDFEFITISADEPAKKDKALAFLKKSGAANTNYIFDNEDKYKLIEAVDKSWQGALPYTLVVEPGGKIVYGKQGTIDPDEMKRIIVDHPLIGRYY